MSTTIFNSHSNCYKWMWSIWIFRFTPNKFLWGFSTQKLVINTGLWFDEFMTLVNSRRKNVTDWLYGWRNDSRTNVTKVNESWKQLLIGLIKELRLNGWIEGVHWENVLIIFHEADFVIFCMSVTFRASRKRAVHWW